MHFGILRYSAPADSFSVRTVDFHMMWARRASQGLLNTAYQGLKSSQNGVCWKGPFSIQMRKRAVIWAEACPTTALSPAPLRHPEVLWVCLKVKHTYLPLQSTAQTLLLCYNYTEKKFYLPSSWKSPFYSPRLLTHSILLGTMDPIALQNQYLSPTKVLQKAANM